jgi:hypothetical protein
LSQFLPEFPRREDEETAAVIRAQRQNSTGIPSLLDPIGSLVPIVEKLIAKALLFAALYHWLKHR